MTEAGTAHAKSPGPLDIQGRHTAGPWYLTSITALGIVFGDIGTSPLYAFQVALKMTDRLLPPAFDVFGICSLVFWMLTLIVAVKYVSIVMRADNEGEGGILALLSLVYRMPERRGVNIPFLLLLGILGAALLYGDGVITPAISVLSAVEGLKVIQPHLAHMIVPITMAILLALFLLQHRGTATIGRFFGPIMLAWFLVIGLVGLWSVIQTPRILLSIDPWYGIRFLLREPGTSFIVFGAVFLALTGAEALYADMGHVGAPAIRRAWFGLVMPALCLNYFGQAALLLREPRAADNPFYKIVPDWAVVPMIFLAAAATVIASQALISGVFSLTRQAISMRLSPRMAISATSSHSYGQIYIGTVNWALMVATLIVVVQFRTSDSLASAYGIAVSGTMLITTMLLFKVMSEKWELPTPICWGLTILFGLVDAIFFAANSIKIEAGGWLPLTIGGFVAFAMISWMRGNALVRMKTADSSMPFAEFMDNLGVLVLARQPGCGVFLTQISETVSPMLLRYVEANRVLHENVILLTIMATRRPRVPASERITIQPLGKGFYRVIVSVGFMQRVDLPLAIRSCERLGLDFCDDEGADAPFYFIAHEVVVRKARGSKLRLPFWIAFIFMHRLAMHVSDYLHLPPKRVMEVGFRVDI
ncbi:MAG TPA: KUP/HAK/KT family potassium transporter [Stellaceae bacterium]|nr:KUP/HAK/KT family potassium transporter [Stellaceae bacterium]